MGSVRSDNRASDATLPFGEDVTQYRMVNFDLATGLLQLPDTLGHRVVGISQGDVDISVKETGKVRTLGHSKVELGETMVPGMAVMAGTDGRAVEWTALLAQAGTLLVGGVAGELVEMVLNPSGIGTVS